MICHRAKQVVHGRPAAILGRIVGELQQPRAAGCGNEPHLLSSGSDICVVGGNRLVVRRLADSHGAVCGEVGCQQLGEDRRHVLHDHDRHSQIPGQSRKDGCQRIRPAGGDADHHHFRFLAWRCCRKNPARNLRRWSSRDRRLRFRPLPRVDAGAQQILHVQTVSQCAQPGRQLLANRTKILFCGRVCRLGDEVEGSVLQRLQGRLAAADGQAADHQHLHVDCALAQRLHHLDAVHARHLDVQRHQVGP